LIFEAVRRAAEGIGGQAPSRLRTRRAHARARGIAQVRVRCVRRVVDGSAPEHERLAVAYEPAMITLRD